MIDTSIGGILRRRMPTANSALIRVALGAALVALAFAQTATGQRTIVDHATEIKTFRWDFGRADDPQFVKFPFRWKRYEGIGYPGYVQCEITARDQDLENQLIALDTQLVRMWTQLVNKFPALSELLPLPPSIADILTDRYLRVELDGGQFAAQSPTTPISRRYQYRFRCHMKTRGLVHDRAIAELIFLDRDGIEMETHRTAAARGTIDWTEFTIQPVQPPIGATDMLVRLRVRRSDDGLEDIRGEVGFDDIHIDQLPQLALITDRPRGVYRPHELVTASAKIMGLPKRESRIRFRLLDHHRQPLSQTVRRVTIESKLDDALPPHDRWTIDDSPIPDPAEGSIGTAVHWQLPPLAPGFYRVTAEIDGHRVPTLATETTFVVIDQIRAGNGLSCFGWTLPQGRQKVPPRELAPWLADFGVSWVKYPCWLAPDDVAGAEEAATVFSRLQDQGIETIAMLDVPPESQQSLYELRGRRDLVAAQLFRNQTVWQPLLEPVMTRMTLKVRRWQLGADRDHSFLGRPHLKESIQQISSGLQGFGQPIDVAISWPWDESQFRDGASSWQAECRSSDPPLNANELDAHLARASLDSRPESPRTWLLIDPVSSDRYDQTARIQDLVLRMATVRSHRVQAAFVSNPRDEKQGLLRGDGRPGELLLPWRTTAQLIGKLRRSGSLKLRNGSDNIVFAGDSRAVLMLWSPVSAEEKLYLGERAKLVDVWGKSRPLPVEMDGNQPVQVVPTGPEPVFVIDADPDLLRFRMSLAVEPTRLDSLIGRNQRLTVNFENLSEDSLVGDMKVIAPESWIIENPKRQWQAFSGRGVSQGFNVALTNITTIGRYELPIQIDLDSAPPRRITVYRKVDVGPEGVEIDVKTKLLERNGLVVQVEITNRTWKPKSFDCLLFPPAGRQFQERVMTIEPDTTMRREYFWPDAKKFLGQSMILRAVEQDGPRVINYRFRVRG